MTDDTSWIVKYVPLASTVDSSFWVQYCQDKLDTIQLSESPLPLAASYTVGTPRLQLSSPDISNDRIALHGSLKGYNTLEAFQKEDKNALLENSFCQTFLQSEESVHASFVLLTYPDLKNHKVLYWFAVPAMMPRSGSSIRAVKQEPLAEAMITTTSPDLALQIRNFRSHIPQTEACPPYFLVDREMSRVTELSRSAFREWMASSTTASPQGVLFGFFDPSPIVTTSNNRDATMGWPMRNLVAYLSLHLGLGGSTVRILSYRPKRLGRVSRDDILASHHEDGMDSLILHVPIPHPNEYEWEDGTTYKAVGWELNARSKPGPRWVNLRPLLDSHHLAVQAADLNLKLMKWRMLPELQLETLQGMKVLLIGAGTLGCSVARVLLGWGVRNIKFVDYGQVSYSNPVRQALFTLQDCKDGEKDKGGGGRPKAKAAAEALETIVADVDSEGIVLSIPMPGHAETLESLNQTVPALDALVQECDVVFLLTDTRESRWLPTVMAAAHNKLLLNAALGLDSWLVMRHGAASGENRLGCYFCNDVVAPENSMKNRTLDQQCTVTRPGLSPIASSMVVELMVALLHHPKRHSAPAPRSTASSFSPTVSSLEGEDTSSSLGIMPHQIRGSLVSYTMMTPTVPAFSCCTGCAPAVVEAYHEDKVGLVHQVCQSANGSFLEDLSGLTDFRADASAKMDEMDGWDDDDVEEG